MDFDYMSDKGKIATALLFVSLLPVVVGALVAPFAFNTLVRLGRNFERFEGLRQIEFESILTRSILICAFALLWPALRIAASGGFSIKKIFVRRGWLKEASLGFVAGIASMGLIPLVGVLLGSYAVRDDLKTSLLLGGILFLLAALIVSVLEEALFRGVIYSFLERLVKLFPAVLLGGLLFSLAHFLNPLRPAGVVYGHWYSGFQTLRQAVISFDLGSSHIFPYSLTLLLIGCSLCIIFRQRGDVLMIVGIHAGWIWVLKMSARLLERTKVHPWLFGHDMIIGKTYAAMIVAGVFLLLAILASASCGFRSKKK